MKTEENTLDNHISPLRDGQLESPWLTQLPVYTKQSDKPEEVYDVLVIGGGITGITAALMLQKTGKKCLIAEAHTIGFGTTGGTSAHINTFADTTYAEAERAFGETGARLFAEAITEGLGIIRSNVETYRIDCDFESKKGYIFAEDDEQAKQLEDLYKGTLKVGVNISYTTEVPIPLAYQKAVILEGQAQFHPIKYILALADEFTKAGGIVLEHTKIDFLKHKEDLHIAKAGDKEIHSRKVIYATHIPPGITSFNFRCAPYRSYVIAAKLTGNNYPDALIYDVYDPYHYIRSHKIGDDQLLFVGGNDHKTGHENPEQAFDELEKYVRKHYSVSSIIYKWSSQYYIPDDGFPYIGQMPEAAVGVYCATGFNGNGMMLGTISAKILSDLITGKPSKYENVFNPSRIKPVAGFTEFVKENADVAYHFIVDRFTIKETDSLKRLQPGTGRLVELEGKKVAAYRDNKGNIHALNPVCTHAKCIVNWNPEEKSWDCPCHGARYDINGIVLNGPANKNLEQIKLSELITIKES
jgi:glycine/D-amino acid oxidase-like deaminating enzyme/nitrite reductase/ring-hydroxylating ferredoxin subunit